MVTRVLIVASLALAGCEKKSELYCEKHPEDIQNCGYTDAGIDARPPCAGPDDCAAPAAVCDTMAGVCVECLEDMDCSDPMRAQCNPQTYTCQGCSAHADCASEACLPNGTCGDDSTVAYVDPAGTATTGCTLLDPCGLVDDALAANRMFVKLTGALVGPVVVDGLSRTFLADPDTTLTRSNGGVLFDIKGGSTVAIYDLTLIANDEAGIKVTSSTARLFRVMVTNANKNDTAAVTAAASTLTMSRCLIHNNLGGGIEADANTTYNITNNFIVRNGKDDSNLGGVTLDATTAGERRFEFNTVVDNRAKAATQGVAGGVACAASDLAIPNNLIVRNYGGGSTTLAGANELPTLSTLRCNTSASRVGPDVAPYMFVDPDAATGAGNYHILPGSQAIEQGMISNIDFDVDGELRPQGTGFDVGADEYKQ